MKHPIRRFKQWDRWRKRSLNGPIHKLLVLLGLIYSPTFDDIEEE